MSTAHGQDQSPPNYAQQHSYAGPGVGQPYGGQTYVQPAQPPQNYGQTHTTIHTTNVTQPAAFQVVQPALMEHPTAKKLNLASAIISGVCFALTIIGLIVGPASAEYGRYAIIVVTAPLGIIGGIFLLIGMILSCVTAFSNQTNKRGMLIGAIVMYCLSVIFLLTWAGVGVFLWDYMPLFLVVGIGSLALAILSGISCSMYRDSALVVYGGAAPPVVIGGGVVMGQQPQTVVVNTGY